MDPIIFGNLINAFGVAMLLASMLAMASTRITQLIKLLVLQSVCLAVFEFAVAYSANNSHIYTMCVLTIIVKVVIIPRVLKYILERINADDEVDLSLGTPGSLLVSGALIIFSFFVTEPLISSLATSERNSLVLSFSIMLIGLLMMTTRKKAISEAIGLLMMENGLFLGAIALSNGMPLLVELGAFFDVIMMLIILGIFAFRMNRSFNAVDTSLLRRLKE